MKAGLSLRDLFLALVSLLIGFLSPTLQVLSSAPIGEWGIAHYEIGYRSQLITAVVLGAVLMLIVLLLEKHTRRMDAVTSYIVSWFVGGFVFVLCQAEMFYLTLVAFGQSYPQGDVWYGIFTKESGWNIVWAGLLVAIVSGIYQKPGAEPKSEILIMQNGEALSNLSELVNDVPPERLPR